MANTFKILKILFLITNTLLLLLTLIAVGSHSYLIHKPETVVKADTEEKKNFVRNKATAFLICALIDIALAILAYCGLLKSKPWVLFTYIVLTVIMFIVSFALAVVYYSRGANLHINDSDPKYSTDALLAGLTFAVGICLFVLYVANLILCFFVAYMMRKRAKEPSQPPKAYAYGPPRAAVGH